MTREEAQHILHLCRPGRDDDRDDPLIAEAAALLDSDPELREWFDAQQSFDAEFAEELSKVRPPADLRSSILAGMRAHARAPRPQTGAERAALVAGRDDLPTGDRAWWRRPWIGVAAAAAAVALLLLLPQPNPPAAQDNAVATAGVPDVVRFLAGQIESLPDRGLDKMDDRMGELTAYLAAKTAPTPGRIPGKLDAMAPLGCVAFDYHGIKLSMICFNNGAVYHLVTVQQSDLNEALPNRPRVYQLGEQAFRLWQENGKVYILSTHGDTETINEII